MALTPQAARRRFRVLIGGALAVLVIGVIAGVLAWVPVWNGPDPSRDPQWWWRPSLFLIQVGSALTVGFAVTWWLAKRQARRQ